MLFGTILGIFLDILRQKGKKGFDVFLTHLEREYSEVYEKITGKKAIVPDSKHPTIRLLYEIMYILDRLC